MRRVFMISEKEGDKMPKNNNKQTVDELKNQIRGLTIKSLR